MENNTKNAPPPKSMRELLTRGKKQVKQANSYGGDDVSWKASLMRYLTVALFPELYEKRLTLGGSQVLPSLCLEQQHDHTKRTVHTATMTRMQRETQHLVEGYDRQRGDAGLRIIILKQKKYAMHNNGDHGDNSARKETSIAIARNLFTQYLAQEYLDFLEQTHLSGHEVDDMTDAFLLALEWIIDHYVTMCLNLFEHEMPHNWSPLRTGTTGKIEDALKDMTLVLLGTDFGTVNFADCLIQVKGLCPGRWENYVTDKGETKRHYLGKPVFRILRWRLIDLKRNVVKANWVAPPNARYYEPVAGREDWVAEKLPRRPSGTFSEKKRPRVPSSSSEDDESEESESEEQPPKKKPRLVILDVVSEEDDSSSSSSNSSQVIDIDSD